MYYITEQDSYIAYYINKMSSIPKDYMFVIIATLIIILYFRVQFLEIKLQYFHISL